ncbi:MAG: hypothetical protein QHI48_04125 [Bacteroidota bacterium]|nr:hypothetical protein [Bacteroidota bacterium]
MLFLGPSGQSGVRAKTMHDVIRITAERNEDMRSLRVLHKIVCKGVAASAERAAVLGHERDDIDGFIQRALAVATSEPLSTL